MQSNAIKDLSMADDLRVADYVVVQMLVNLQNTRGSAHSGENAVLFGQDGGRCALLWVNAGA
jgi:hypothetical protein